MINNVLGDNIGYIELIDYVGNDNFICDSARVTTGSQGKDNYKLLKYLLSHRHTSPFEFVKFVFEIKAPIFVARQWVRHRMANWNEISGRYSELPEEFYIRKHYNKQDTVNRQGSTSELIDFSPEQVRHYCNSGYELYQQMLEAGISKEQARQHLPVNIYTKWRWGIDLHNLMNFIRLRLDNHAQEEIRLYGQAIVELITPIVPLTMDIFNEQRNI